MPEEGVSARTVNMCYFDWRQTFSGLLAAEFSDICAEITSPARTMSGHRIISCLMTFKVLTGLPQLKELCSIKVKDSHHKAREESERQEEKLQRRRQGHDKTAERKRRPQYLVCAVEFPDEGSVLCPRPCLRDSWRRHLGQDAAQGIRACLGLLCSEVTNIKHTWE